MARSTRDSRVTALLALTIVAALFALAQRTVWAPLPHSIDDFLGGLAVGLALSTLIARWMSR